MSKSKRKFLKTIYSIQANFDTGFGRVSRNFSFGLLPKNQQLEPLNKWYKEVKTAKELLYQEIYEGFKKLPNKYLDNTFDYKTFFSGRSVINSIRSNTEIITSQPVMEGLSMEISGSIRSFITNHKRIFDDNKAEFLEARKTIEENKKILEDQDSTTTVQDKLDQLLNSLLEKDYGQIILNYPVLDKYNKLLNSFNTLISEYNYELNQLNTKLKLDLRTIDRLSNLPSFPGVKAEENINIDQLLKEFKLKARKSVITSLVIEFLTKRIKNLDEEKSSKRKRFEDRLLFHFFKNGGITKENIKQYLVGLDDKIATLETHFRQKPFDAGSRNQYFELLAYRARLADPDNLLEINNLLSRIKGFYIKGKEIMEVITIPGFSWDKKENGKPLKNVALAIDKSDEREKLIFCLASSSVPFILNHEGKLWFLKTTGGQKRKNSKPKTIEYVKGDFLDENSEGTPLLLPLHFGKSYARRYLYQKNWGLFSKTPQIFLNNGRLKRLKKRPGDPWDYYFDITLSGEKIFGYKDFAKNIINKVECVIGVDRGEAKPISYAVVRLKDGEVVEKGFLAENYISKLLEYHEKKKKAQRLGRVPKYLSSKIIRLQETVLETAVSEILSLLSSYRGIVAIEDLNRKFKGSERSLVPKKTYKKVEKLLIDSLELAGLLRVDDRGCFWGGLTKVSPAGTSQICLECKTVWKKELKDNVYEYSKSKNFSNIDWSTESLRYNGDKLKLNNKFVVYNRESKHNEEKTITDFKKAIVGKEESKIVKYFKLVLGPRISQDVFICPKCSFKENADIVGAVNIARRGMERILNLRNLN